MRVVTLTLPREATRPPWAHEARRPQAVAAFGSESCRSLEAQFSYTDGLDEVSSMDRLKLKARLLEELLKLLADRRPNPDPDLDLSQRKRFTRIVSLIVKMQSRSAGPK